MHTSRSAICGRARGYVITSSFVSFLSLALTCDSHGTARLRIWCDETIPRLTVRFFGGVFLLPERSIFFFPLVHRMDTQVLEKKKTGGYYSIISEAVAPCGCRVGIRAGRIIRIDCYELRH